MVSRDEIPRSSWRARSQSRFVSPSRDALSFPCTLRSPSPHSAIGSSPCLMIETGTGTRSLDATNVSRLNANLDGGCNHVAATTLRRLRPPQEHALARRPGGHLQQRQLTHLHAIPEDFRCDYRLFSFSECQQRGAADHRHVGTRNLAFSRGLT